MGVGPHVARQGAGGRTAPPHARIVVRALVGLVRLYQMCFSHFLGGYCRFQPSCSQYAVEALHQHGALRGTLLAAARVTKCRPFGAHGFDPVPRA